MEAARSLLEYRLEITRRLLGEHMGTQLYYTNDFEGKDKDIKFKD